jgi:hypothetical protein
MTRWRRLVRDYEKRIDVSHAMILVAMGGNLIRRNAHPDLLKFSRTPGSTRTERLKRNPMLPPSCPQTERNLFVLLGP